MSWGPSTLSKNETISAWFTTNETKVVLANVDAKADTGGVTSLVLDKCWR